MADDSSGLAQQLEPMRPDAFLFQRPAKALNESAYSGVYGERLAICFF